MDAGEFFLKQGKVSDAIAYISKGLLRAWFYNDRGEEVTSQFFPEGSLVMSLESFNSQIPSKENITAITACELMIISYQRQKELYDLVPAWNQICRDLADLNSRQMMERAERFQTMSASGRYQLFCKEYPQVLLHARLGDIASYLGVDIATLSRIRRRK